MSTGNSLATLPGPAGQQHDAIAEADGLADVVGHEQDRPAGRLPDPLELVVEDVAGHRVERPEGLVHQQDSASWARARASATRWRMPPESSWGCLLAEARQLDQLEQLVDPLASGRLLGTLRRRSGSSTFSATVSHGNSAASWNMRPAGRPGTRPCPRVGWSRPATRLSSVDLPQPEAPTRQTNSPVRTPVEAVEGEDRVRTPAVDLGHAVEVDGRHVAQPLRRPGSTLASAVLAIGHRP